MASNELRRRTGSTNDSTAEEYAIQHDLFGPISGALLIDPVRIQGDNAPVAFEREYITRWLTEKGTSPTSRNPATVAELVPAIDIQQEIQKLVRRYPDAQIVKDWLQEQPTWYTRAIQGIKNTGLPVVQAMTRTANRIQQNPTAVSCARCCRCCAETAAGAVVGAGVGACAGCACGISITGDGNFDEATSRMITGTAVGAGAASGVFVGSYLGPTKCLEGACDACKSCWNNTDWDDDGWAGGKRKTIKGKRKKRRKTRRRKKKITRRRKRKTKRKHTKKKKR